MLQEQHKSPKPQTPEPADRGKMKPPDRWVTGDEPMTRAQASYLETLAREAGEKVEPNLSKAEASKKIDELRKKTGRGLEDPRRETKAPKEQ
jgi:hypothetical protein